MKKYPTQVSVAVSVVLTAIAYFVTSLIVGPITEPFKGFGGWLVVMGIAGRLVYNALVPAPARPAAGE